MRNLPAYYNNFMVSLFVVIMMFCYVIEKGFGIMKGVGNRGFLCDSYVIEKYIILVITYKV